MTRVPTSSCRRTGVALAAMARVQAPSRSAVAGVARVRSMRSLPAAVTAVRTAVASTNARAFSTTAPGQDASHESTDSAHSSAFDPETKILQHALHHVGVHGYCSWIWINYCWYKRV